MTNAWKHATYMPPATCISMLLKQCQKPRQRYQRTPSRPSNIRLAHIEKEGGVAEWADDFLHDFNEGGVCFVLTSSDEPALHALLALHVMCVMAMVCIWESVGSLVGSGRDGDREGLGEIDSDLPAITHWRQLA